MDSYSGSLPVSGTIIVTPPMASHCLILSQHLLRTHFTYSFGDLLLRTSEPQSRQIKVNDNLVYC